MHPAASASLGVGMVPTLVVGLVLLVSIVAALTLCLWKKKSRPAAAYGQPYASTSTSTSTSTRTGTGTGSATNAYHQHNAIFNATTVGTPPHKPPPMVISNMPSPTFSPAFDPNAVSTAPVRSPPQATPPPPLLSQTGTINASNSSQQHLNHSLHDDSTLVAHSINEELQSGYVETSHPSLSSSIAANVETERRVLGTSLGSPRDGVDGDDTITSGYVDSSHPSLSQARSTSQASDIASNIESNDDAQGLTSGYVESGHASISVPTQSPHSVDKARKGSAGPQRPGIGTIGKNDSIYQIPPNKEEGVKEFLLSLVPEVSLEELRIDGVLGQGNFGVVSKGVLSFADGTASDVAVKVLSDNHSGDAASPSSSLAFLQEAALQAQFNHPNIVRLLGVVTASSPNMIVLEICRLGELRCLLLERQENEQMQALLTLGESMFDDDDDNDDDDDHVGGNDAEASSRGKHEVSGSGVVSTESSLCAVLKKGGDRLDAVVKQQERLLWRLNAAHDIVNGCVYMASLGFVHRDLAARNVLVAADGVCKIADFGLARETMHGTDSDYYLSTGGKLPIRWTAPEAIFYKKFSSASDVWSFSCIMHEIFHGGKRPYHKMKNADVVRFLQAGQRLPPGKDVPVSVYKLQIACWHADAESRPTFEEIEAKVSEWVSRCKDELSALQKDTPLHASRGKQSMSEGNLQRLLTANRTVFALDRDEDSLNELHRAYMPDNGAVQQQLIDDDDKYASVLDLLQRTEEDAEDVYYSKARGKNSKLYEALSKTLAASRMASVSATNAGDGATQRDATDARTNDEISVPPPPLPKRKYSAKEAAQLISTNQQQAVVPPRPNVDDPYASPRQLLTSAEKKSQHQDAQAGEIALHESDDGSAVGGQGKKRSLAACSWYFGTISRNRAEFLLHQYNQVMGVKSPFLVRSKSTVVGDSYALSMIRKRRYVHHLIERRQKGSVSEAAEVAGEDANGLGSSTQALEDIREGEDEGEVEARGGLDEDGEDIYVILESDEEGDGEEEDEYGELFNVWTMNGSHLSGVHPTATIQDVIAYLQTNRRYKSLFKTGSLISSTPANRHYCIEQGWLPKPAKSAVVKRRSRLYSASLPPVTTSA